MSHEYDYGVVGSTGFVGSNIMNSLKQVSDSVMGFNSLTIDTIDQYTFNTLFIAAPSGSKWQANNDPRADLLQIKRLIRDLWRVRRQVKQLILISTVDVYDKPIWVNEYDVPQANEPYGQHRFYLEWALLQEFRSITVVRLPALFGPGLKKNFIFDILTDNTPERFTHRQSSFQFFPVKNVAAIASRANHLGLRYLNVATEPIEARRIALLLGKTDYESIEPPIVTYDMRTAHAHHFGGHGTYLFMHEDVEGQLINFRKEWTNAVSNF